MLVGYARTSTADQIAGLDAQARELKAAGCTKLFSEQISSVAHRPKLIECLAFLREGDTPGLAFTAEYAVLRVGAVRGDF